MTYNVKYSSDEKKFSVDEMSIGVPCSSDDRAREMSNYVRECVMVMEEGLKAISRAHDPTHVYNALGTVVSSLTEQAKSYAGVLNPMEREVDGE